MIKVQRFQFYELVSALVLILLLVFLVLSLSLKMRRACLSNCTGNMKQLGNAAALYEGDNRGDRPGPQPLGPNNMLVSWDRPLAIQMGASLGIAGAGEPLARLTSIPRHSAFKTLITFTCPVDMQQDGARMVPEKPGSFTDGIADGKGICRSYSLNLGSGNLAGHEDGIATTASAIPVVDIESGAGTVYLVENHGYATVFGQRNIANDATVACSKEGKMMPADAFTNPAAPMHGIRIRPRCGFLMYDGHVELVEQSNAVSRGGEIMQIGKWHEEPTAGKEETP